MTRCCSHCNSNAHNNRSCGGVRLFGVRLTNESSMKKSASMGSLSHHSAATDSLDGYHSDDLGHGFTARHRPLRKKGVPWTEQEHRQFLLGLEQLGKGNWRAISRNYVHSRTPTQIASHAQKYFIHLSHANEPGKKKRHSLFDLATDMETNSSQTEVTEQFSISSPAVGTIDGEIMLSSSQAADMNNSLPSLDLTLKPAFTTFHFQLWPPNAFPLEDYGAETSQHQILRPEPVVQENSIKELVSMPQLTLGETGIAN